MTEHKARIKKLTDDSKILSIGSLFRGVGNKTWSIDIGFNGGVSDSLQFGNIPILARKRVLNATEQYKKAGSALLLSVADAKEWVVKKASECPAYRSHKHGKDGDQNCFVAKVGEKQVFIPQLELARILFYHDPFMARLSLLHNSLYEDFMLSTNEDGQPLVIVREGAEYPISYFNRDDNRRFLSWVLLDSDARSSFESIYQYLLCSHKLSDSYERWAFQFAPPALTGASLTVRGWNDSDSSSFFVWEITHLTNLPSQIDGEVDFFHPKYARKMGGKPTTGDGKQGRVPDQYEIDDEELSDADKATVYLISEKTRISFKSPFITNRVAEKTKAVSHIIGDSDDEVLSKELSVNEREQGGNFPGGSWNNLKDETDDAHLYLGKFKSFLDMVNVLVSSYNFKLVEKRISKLPELGRSNKHLLFDTQNPRCIVYVTLEYHEKQYTLLEIDTSDDIVSLSTMLISSKSGWIKANFENVQYLIMKASLGWPHKFFTKYIEKPNFIGISHPQSKHPGMLAPEAINPWAARVEGWIQSR